MAWVHKARLTVVPVVAPRWGALPSTIHGRWWIAARAGRVRFRQHWSGAPYPPYGSVALFSVVVVFVIDRLSDDEYDYDNDNEA